MFRHALIGVLFYVVFISKESFGTDVNAILRNPGWERITNVGAKYRFFLNRNVSFTGKDVFVPDNPSIDNENSVNTSVGEHSDSVKHYMVTHLLACVYVNATVRFLELLKRILEVCSRATHCIRNSFYRKRKKSKDAEAEKETTVVRSLEGREDNSDHSQDGPVKGEFLDLKDSWTIFNFAILQLTNSSPMFDRMYSAIKYLTDTMPSEASFDGYTRERLVFLVLPSLKEFKDTSKNVNLVLPKYAGDTDLDYNKKLGRLSLKLSLFFNNQAKTFLLPFIDEFCTVSDTAIPSVSEQIDVCKDAYRKQPAPLDVAYQFAIQISRLVNEEVCRNYYSELGFLYDIAEQTTSFQRPPSPPSPPSPETSQNLTELQLFI